MVHHPWRRMMQPRHEWWNSAPRLAIAALWRRAKREMASLRRSARGPCSARERFTERATARSPVVTADAGTARRIVSKPDSKTTNRHRTASDDIRPVAPPLGNPREASGVVVRNQTRRCKQATTGCLLVRFFLLLGVLLDDLLREVLRHLLVVREL